MCLLFSRHWDDISRDSWECRIAVTPLIGILLTARHMLVRDLVNCWITIMASGITFLSFAIFLWGKFLSHHVFSHQEPNPNSGNRWIFSIGLLSSSLGISCGVPAICLEIQAFEPDESSGSTPCHAAHRHSKKQMSRHGGA